jgi:hypothetical protein
MFENYLNKSRIFKRLTIITFFGMFGGLILGLIVLATMNFDVVTVRDLESLFYLFPFILITAVLNSLFLGFSSSYDRKAYDCIGDDSEEHF